ncbi:MAG: DUF488 domain-containing protein [Planctomycetota bacterium]|jgi:uncharacterized protein (DUF488 family)
MRVWTIGFTKKSAEQFFETLSASGAKRVLDVRLKNVSQLAGFAKKEDLAWFLDRLCGIGYEHLPILAPTEELMSDYKEGRMTWPAFERRFLHLMTERRVEHALSPALVADACLLCSEHEPDRCHRRLVAEYLHRKWGGLEIRHLTT